MKRHYLVCLLLIMVLSPLGASHAQTPSPAPSQSAWFAGEGVTVTPTTISTTEGGAGDSFNVFLNSVPSGNVVITITTLDPTEGIPLEGPLLFDSTNWNVAQTVHVPAIDDDIDDGTINYTIEVDIDTVNTTDNAYDLIDPADVSASNADDDTAGVSVTPLTLNTSEAGTTATFFVSLTSEPLGDVVVDVASLDTSEGTLNVSSVSFDDTNWSVQQSVIVTGIDDGALDGHITYTIDVTINTALTTDSMYDSMNPANVSVTNNDNERPSFPNPVSPTHKAHTTDTTPTFTWTQVSGADMYRVRVYKEDLSYDVKERTVGNTATSFTWQENLSVGKYLWRVRGRNGASQVWSLYSARFTLFVD
jgi:hypothetical protein